ncbi:MAG: hypothetical protein JO021_15060 [Alphaproteobacteria bacterium]|nr:hypothetical protein [Alphaproteobacteria bacterium]
MTTHRRDGGPEPYRPVDPAETGAWPPGTEPTGAPVRRQGRTVVTAAGERIGVAPDCGDLGPSGGGPLEEPGPPGKR